MELDYSRELPADTDIESLLEQGPLDALASVIHTYEFATWCRDMLAQYDGQPDDALSNGRTVAERRDSTNRWLDNSAPVTTLQALQAIHRASQQLTASRFRAVRAARTEGHSWSAIGDALEMSKQGAQDWYNNRALPFEQDDDK